MKLLVYISLLSALLYTSCTKDDSNKTPSIPDNEWNFDNTADFNRLALDNSITAKRIMKLGDKEQIGETTVNVAFSEKTVVFMDYGFEIQIPYLFINYGFPTIFIDENYVRGEDIDIMYKEDHCFIKNDSKEYIISQLEKGKSVTFKVSASDSDTRYEVSFELHPYNFYEKYLTIE